MLEFETSQDALKWRKAHRKQLQSGNRRQRQVARQLNRCRKQTRCVTEACRVCLRDFRVQWIGEGTKTLVQRRHWTVCSIIPAGSLVPNGSLNSFDLQAARKRDLKRLARSGI